MFFNYFGRLFVLLASVQGFSYEFDEPIAANRNCSKVIRKLTVEEQERLDQVVAVYNNFETSPLQKIDGFLKILKEYGLPHKMAKGVETLMFFSFTAYEHSVEKRTNELNALVDMALSSLLDDPDIQEMVETVMKLPPLVFNIFFKTLGKISEETPKRTQAALWNMMLSEEYLETEDVEKKKNLVADVLTCYVRGVDGVVGKLVTPLEMIRRVEL